MFMVISIGAHYVGNLAAYFNKSRENSTSVGSSNLSEHEYDASQDGSSYVGAGTVQRFNNKPRYTHFISIPLNEQSLQWRMQDFQSDAIAYCAVDSPSLSYLFQKPEKLHLTVCMLSVPEERLQEALDAFNHCKEKIIMPLLNNNPAPVLDLKGIGTFPTNAKRARVVHINVVDNTKTIDKLMKAVSDYFLDLGLTRKDKVYSKMHLTVMNASFTSRRSKKRHYVFDARRIVQRYKDINWGSVHISMLHFSSLKEKGPDGYFHALAHMNI
ncbi:hypothetical protein TKK_0013396 [Trichogramma kaykai]|uniref:A-kinase anchor protein 7-like phosphoesterase domain-containing protein n=1 Tax=Trichogramma kaykai TaxID=54128 RepID=A0ABD2WHQ9_9HYME